MALIVTIFHNIREKSCLKKGVVLKMLKLLLIGEDTTKLVINNYSYLERELSKITDLTVWRKSGDIKDILAQLPAKPDFILINDDIGSCFPLNISGLSTINIPVGLVVNDVHQYVQFRENYINQNNIKYLFSVIKYKFFEVYPKFIDRFIRLPHYIEPNIFHDYGLKREVDMLMMGALLDGWYPLRQTIHEHYKNHSNFVYQKHPGYYRFPDPSQLLIGQNYARELNKAKLFFTCGSILNYPVLKYFEVLACKTLLLAPTFPELEELGFIPGKHFVSITKDDFADKAEYYLANEKERNTIIEQGHKFIKENHTVQIRAKQLVIRIEEILKNEA